MQIVKIITYYCYKILSLLKMEQPRFQLDHSLKTGEERCECGDKHQSEFYIRDNLDGKLFCNRCYNNKFIGAYPTSFPGSMSESEIVQSIALANRIYSTIGTTPPSPFHTTSDECNILPATSFSSSSSSSLQISHPHVKLSDDYDDGSEDNNDVNIEDSSDIGPCCSTILNLSDAPPDDGEDKIRPSQLCTHCCRFRPCTVHVCMQGCVAAEADVKIVGCIPTCNGLGRSYAYCSSDFCGFECAYTHMYNVHDIDAWEITEDMVFITRPLSL